MGFEKEGSKGKGVGGGYVGGFLQLFDWNAKSRKKLFSSKSDLPERSKQKKRCDGNLPMTRFHLIDDDEMAVEPSVKGSSDYSYASSVTDEDFSGIRGPGVVARLMGLDTMPTSNLSEPYTSPFSNSQIMNYRNCDPKMEAEKPHKTTNKPIKKFQTEVLPPKSAKSIPITHHKLLSPIKSGGFIPSKNAAHIMEAAAKIIESSPQAAAASTRSKMPMIGSTSAPLKVRDLREKVEASQKPPKIVESNAAKCLKGQSMNKSWNGSSDSNSSIRVLHDSEEFSSGARNNGKSISLAVQAKVNVQKREGKNPLGQKESSEMITSSQVFKSQPKAQNNTQKKPSGVLKQNNQKQNAVTDRAKLPSKPLVSNLQGRKKVSGDSSFGQQISDSKSARTTKIGSRKFVSEAINCSKRESPYAGMKNASRKKRPMDGDFQFVKNKGVADSMPIDKNGQFNWAEDNGSKGLDVVSFTFTAPLTRSMSGHDISREEKNYGFSADYRSKKLFLNGDVTCSSKLSSLGCNVIRGDDLSSLLEHKLNELTHGVESTHRKEGRSGSSALAFQELAHSLKEVKTLPTLHGGMRQDGMDIDTMDSQYAYGFSSNYRLGFGTNHMAQRVEATDECSSNGIDPQKLFNNRHRSPVSVIEPSFSTESCNSSNTTYSNSIEGMKQFSSVQAQEIFGIISSRKHNILEADLDLSDSASSTSTRTNYFIKSNEWEIEYFNQILCNVELMFKDYALGRAREIINPHLFDQLECRRGGLFGKEDSENKIERKILFDCVRECLHTRCKTWGKGLSTVRRRKEVLVHEVYREVSGWRGMGDCMVDELVDKDMSSQYGRWLDFEVESFEMGTEIEGRILNLLIDELVADILPL